MKTSPTLRHWTDSALALGLGFGVLFLWRSLWTYAAWRLSGLEFTLESFQAHRAALEQWAQAAPLAHGALFCLGYLCINSFCMPGSSTLTIVAGALFGWRWGLLWSLTALTLGSGGAFLWSRWLLGPWVRRGFGEVMGLVARGMRSHGNEWFLTARLFPVSSFTAVNLCMGLTSISLTRFLGLGALGLLPGTAASAYAGSHLGQAQHAVDLVRPEIVGSLVVLTALPWVLKWVLGRWEKTR